MATMMADEGISEPSRKDIQLVITASSLGTIFEWYDFFIYGTLAASGIIGRTFFPAGNETVQTLLAWAGLRSASAFGRWGRCCSVFWVTGSGGNIPFW